MTAIHRLLRILAQFDLDHAVLTPELLMDSLGASRASIYRDLRQLVASGLVERIGERGYALGPRIVELDRQIRLADPLLQAAAELPTKLAKDSGGTVLLCRLHADTVLCIHEARAREGGIATSYERGRAMPLYRGATSKIILAHLPPARIRELLMRDRAAIRAAGLPTTEVALTAHLAALREQGHVTTQGEVDKEAAGIAVALLDGTRLLGSLSVVLSAAQLTRSTAVRCLSQVQSAARRIEARLQDLHTQVRQQRKGKAT